MDHKFTFDVAQWGDALTLLRSLPDGCTPLVIFDPQYRAVLNKLAYGNEGARQCARVALPQMPDSYIDECCRESARVLAPSGYLKLWTDTFGLVEGHHKRIADVLAAVDLICWDHGRIGNGYRSRRCGSYLVVLQKPPIRAKATWRDHGIPDRWFEKIDRRAHPHAKPPGLIKRLIGAVTQPDDLVVDPAAGSFTTMHAAHELGRRFIGCDIAHQAGDEASKAYDANDDFGKSLDAAYAAIRERVANGGQGWKPREAGDPDRITKSTTAHRANTGALK